LAEQITLSAEADGINFQVLVEVIGYFDHHSIGQIIRLAGLATHASRVPNNFFEHQKGMQKLGLVVHEDRIGRPYLSGLQNAQEATGVGVVIEPRRRRVDRPAAMI